MQDPVRDRRGPRGLKQELGVSEGVHKGIIVPLHLAPLKGRNHVRKQCRGLVVASAHHHQQEVERLEGLVIGVLAQQILNELLGARAVDE